jgi:Zn ribbon nucleic-acid-binding protein
MADKPDICGFCHSDKGRETIYVGKIEYASKCVTCGGVQQVSQRDMKKSVREVTQVGFENSPVGIVSRMLQDPYRFFTGKKQKPKD